MTVHCSILHCGIMRFIDVHQCSEAQHNAALQVCSLIQGRVQSTVNAVNTVTTVITVTIAITVTTATTVTVTFSLSLL